MLHYEDRLIDVKNSLSALWRQPTEITAKTTPWMLYEVIEKGDVFDPFAGPRDFFVDQNGPGPTEERVEGEQQPCDVLLQTRCSQIWGLGPSDEGWTVCS